MGIRATSVVNIRGRIQVPFSDANGKRAAPSTTLYLVPPDTGGPLDNAPLTFQNVAANRDDGQFEIRGVQPGSYDLFAGATIPRAASGVTVFNPAGRGGNGIPFMAQDGRLVVIDPTHYAWGRVRVEVGRDDLSGVIVDIKKGVEVKVRVSVDGNPPPFTMSAPPQNTRIDGATVNALTARGASNAEALAAIRAADSANLPASVATPQIRVSLQSRELAPVLAVTEYSFDPSGVYVFRDVPHGRYAVLPAITSSYVADVRLGSVSVFDSGISIDGDLPGEVDVTLSRNGGQIQGTVRRNDEKVAANALVVVAPIAARRQNLALYRNTRSDAAGNFNISSVAPGEYKVFALEGAPDGAWENAEFLMKYEPFGQAVTVSTGLATNTALRLIPIR
jgi:hypothetical protein